MSKLVAITLMAGAVTLTAAHSANAGLRRRCYYRQPAATVWQAPAPVQAAPVQAAPAAPAPAAPQSANRRTYQSYSYEPGAGAVYQSYPVYQPRYYYVQPFGAYGGQSSSRGGTAGSPAPYGY